MYQNIVDTYKPKKASKIGIPVNKKKHRSGIRTSWPKCADWDVDQKLKMANSNEKNLCWCISTNNIARGMVRVSQVCFQPTLNTLSSN
jgi:hypothetical protein